MTAPPTYDDFVRKLFNRSGDPSKDFTHAILGIVTECDELKCAPDLVNAIEEIGDGEFYTFALLQVLKDAFGPQDTSAVAALSVSRLQSIFEDSDPYGALEGVTVSLLDTAKRWVGYGKAPPDVPQTLADAVSILAAIRSLSLFDTAGVTTEHIQAVNMAKLLKRYPGGEFDAFRALQRDLGAERATLESAVLG